jgi:GTP-binding protein
VIAGNGGDGCCSFLRAFANDKAGPDGGDGGNGSHIIFQACTNASDFSHLTSLITGVNGQRGMNKDCHGKNADNKTVRVPIGTIVKNSDGKIVGDLDQDGMMFIAARGGAGGRGNRFFCTNEQQAPEICEYGATGEDVAYFLEVRSMAHVGFIGLPNAGKSTLLRAITRAKPKVAPYAFTTLRPNIGMIPYSDYEQIAVADLPGLIEGSAENRGLGIQFLKHAERCNTLLFVLDASIPEPWNDYFMLMREIEKFSKELVTRKQIIAANKIDIEGAAENVELLREKLGGILVIPISARTGENVAELLRVIRVDYDNSTANNND